MMPELERRLRDAFHEDAQRARLVNPDHPAAYVADGEDAPRMHHRGRRWMLVAAASITVVGLGVLAMTAVQDPVSVQTDLVPPAPAPSTNPAPTPSVPSVDSSPATLPATTTTPAPVAPVVPDTTTPGPITNGWVALDSRESDGGEVYLVRPGEDPHRLNVAGSDPTSGERCPTWSPDGTRLMFGRLTGSNDNFSDPELVIVPIGPDGTAGTPTVIALDGYADPLDFRPHPCGIWASDGRWVALTGPGEVWVVDTQTSEIRRLPDLRPLDFEWRPGTDELAIAGDFDAEVSTPISIYSVSTGELRQLDSIRASQLTWSPDGSTLAYTGGEDQDGQDQAGLRLVDADGTNDRLLVDLGTSNHGVGPVWSPTGDRIVYQRICCGSSEGHEVVLVNVADGTQTVIAPPETGEPNLPVRWYPWTVTWSPDGTTLLYNAWSSAPERNAVLAVPADTPSDVTVLAPTVSASFHPEHHQRVLIQNWGRQPGPSPTTLAAATTAPAVPVPSVVPDTAVAGPATNGWIALHSSIGSDGEDIYLVRPGEDPHRLEVAGSDTTEETCPTWSPDGTRLMLGRLTGSNDNFTDPELVIVPIGPDGTEGTPTVIALDGFGALPGFSPFPCGIWAPDGRWVALRGPGDVWVVDTQTSAIRRLPDLRPLDFEWRPGTDELAIAGDMGMTRGADWLSTPVSVYSVSTGDLRQLGSVETGQLTWSPDGSTLAYTGVEQQDGLRLVDADGTNDRLLVADPGTWNHGVGPVWSPTGERIAYQRICCGAELHEVVLVDVADGTQTVIPPPETVGPSGRSRWYPWIVTWSPDGTTLLYNAWSSAPERDALLAVSADTPSNVAVLTDTGALQPGVHQWVLIQNWGRQP